MERRQGLENAISFSRRGDTLIVTELDRLARSVTYMWEIVRQLEGKGVALRTIKPHVDTGSPTVKLILSVMDGIAEIERSMMLLRQPKGIADAKRERRYKERKPTAGEKATYLRTFQDLIDNLSKFQKARREILHARMFRNYPVRLYEHSANMSHVPAPRLQIPPPRPPARTLPS